MSNRKIQLAAVLDSANRKKDGSISLKFVTNKELTTEEYMVVDTFRQATGWLLFKEDEFTDDDIPEDNAPSDLKSPSLRLRNVLYVYHMNKTGDPSTFRTFYEQTIEKYITKVKESMD